MKRGKATAARSTRKRASPRLSAGSIQSMFERLRSASPKPTTELLYHSPFELLVAVMLSAQATDRSVNLATPALFAAAPTPQAMVELGVEKVRHFIRTIGLFNTKAANVVAMSRLLLERHGGKVPDTRAALEALPGVGRKTANVVLNTAFGQPTIAVDTHIFRVGNRTGLAPGKDVVAVEEALIERVPAEFRMDAHHWLILHGRYVCTARNPECARCVIFDLCAWPQKGSAPATGVPPPRLPDRSTRPKAKPKARKKP
jgi:endonuclease-3